MSTAINLSVFLSSILYPVTWIFFEQNGGPLFFLPWLMAVLWAIRALLQQIAWQRCFSLTMAALLLIVAVTRSLETMYWYPNVISGVMLIIFAGSLFGEQTVVERFARLQTPDLPLYAVTYTRNVTKIWTVFFIFNIIVTTILILFEKYRLWALYTGVISYILMGIIMSVEYCVRKIVMKKYKYDE